LKEEEEEEEDKVYLTVDYMSGEPILREQMDEKTTVDDLRYILRRRGYIPKRLILKGNSKSLDDDVTLAELSTNNTVEMWAIMKPGASPRELDSVRQFLDSLWHAHGFKKWWADDGAQVEEKSLLKKYGPSYIEAAIAWSWFGEGFPNTPPQKWSDENWKTIIDILCKDNECETFMALTEKVVARDSAPGLSSPLYYLIDDYDNIDELTTEVVEPEIDEFINQKKLKAEQREAETAATKEQFNVLRQLILNYGDRFRSASITRDKNRRPVDGDPDFNFQEVMMGKKYEYLIPLLFGRDAVY
jgi:hypothetical protein